MILLKFLTLILFIGTTGWSVWYFFQEKEQQNPAGIFERLENHALIFLTGFGISSVLLFFIAIAGAFDLRIVAVVFSVLSAIFFARQIFFKQTNWYKRFCKYLLSCFLFGIVCFGLGKLVKPYEAVIQGDDASIYIGAAFQLAKSGSLSYHDPLVTEMTPEERNQIFNNRFATDTTGATIRFPGGVRLVNSSTGSVVFSFYHLFPVWLALGIQILGEHFFLNLLILFLALMLISLFLIGRVLGGTLLGLSVCIVAFVFYPQLYFSLMPTSEILTELLFLSGLWLFLSGSKSQTVLNSFQQLILGILWGALFLSRLETLLMLSLSLVFLFTLVPAFSKNLSKWRVLILLLFFFFFIALYYQIVRGEYLYALTSSMFLGNQPIVLIGIELLTSTIHFVQNHVYYGLAVFLILTSIILLGLWWLLGEKTEQRPALRSLIGIMLILISIAAMIGPWASWPRFVKHIKWVGLYFSVPILLTLFVGTLLFVHRVIREKQSSMFIAISIIFWLPAILYLIRPLIIVDQPWGMRKFVPVVFPLFFLISLGGWLYYLKTIFVQRRIIANAAFSGLSLLLVIFFFQNSRYLLQDNLFAGLISQTANLSSLIPNDGLIVIPESWAATHLQISLQYLNRRDTILLPIEKGKDSLLLRSADSFLNRQIERRPVVVLLKSSGDPPSILRNSFRLTRISKTNLSFSHVPRTNKMVFPNHSEKVSLDYAVFSLNHKSKNSYEKLVIPYDDPNASFINFHPKENGFRWTQERSTIKDFLFGMNGKKTNIILSTLSFESEIDPRVELIINDRFPSRLFKKENGDFFFSVDETSFSEITSVTIISKTFVPLEKGLNLDPRRLGLCFAKLTFQRD